MDYAKTVKMKNYYKTNMELAQRTLKLNNNIVGRKIKRYLSFRLMPYPKGYGIFDDVHCFYTLILIFRKK